MFLKYNIVKFLNYRIIYYVNPIFVYEYNEKSLILNIFDHLSAQNVLYEINIER